HLAPTDLAHDLARLPELLDQTAHSLDVRARATGDAQPARALDQLRSAALLRGHREDDRLDPVELALVHLHLLQLVPGQPRDHPEQVRQRAHFANALELTEEVLEVELV